MYSIKGSIHDRYTLEFKIGYSRDSKDQKESDFKMDTWVFIPDVLGINQGTYSKEAFHRDFRNMVRVITPVFSLEQIADPKNLPLSRLEKWCEIIGRPTSPSKRKRHEHMYEHQVKTFCAITRASLRDRVMEVIQLEDATEKKEAVKTIVALMDSILQQFHSMLENTSLSKAPEDKQKIFSQGDEFLCGHTLHTMFALLDNIRKKHREQKDELSAPISDFINRSLAYSKSQGFILPDDSDDVRNRDFLHRSGLLKKYVESDLWILAKSHSNTFFLQQFVFMIAAGLSMVWATVISFSFQQTYGNFTLPFFIALVFSYMLKDRIKQLLQMWFATKLGSYMYETKTKLAFSDEEIGHLKHGMDFVHFHKLPPQVLEQRGTLTSLEAGTLAVKEQVIVFRQRLSIFSQKLARLSHYPLHGINEITRINLREFLRRMDASHAPVYIWDEDNHYHTVQAEKVYYIHFVMRIRYQDKTEFRRYRVCLHRRGAVNIEEY